MYILAIETTGAFASVALLENDKIIGQIQGNDRFSHLQNLMPQIEAVVKEHKLSLGDMTAIAVSCGPGSFTGIRIGISSARALSQALDIPCVEVSSLEALAMNAGLIQSTDAGLVELSSDKNDSDCSSNIETLCDGGKRSFLTTGILLCPILDARRSQVYGGGYFLEDGFPVEKVKAAPYTIEEFLSKTEDYDRILLLGDGADAYREKIAEIRPTGTKTAPESIKYQNAASVVRLGAKIYRETGGLTYSEIKPNYMRLAEAERKLKEKQNKS